MNAQGNIEWTEKATSPDGDNLVITLKLDAIDSGSGFVQENKDSSNVSWLSFSTSSNINSDGSRDVDSTVEVDPNSVDAEKVYRFEILADDGEKKVSRKVTLIVNPIINIVVDSSSISSDLNNFPVYVNLGNMSSSFWNNISNDGSEIKVFDNNDNEVSRELGSINKNNQSGELYFKAPVLYSSSNTQFNLRLSGDDFTGDSSNTWSNGFTYVYHLNEDPGSAPPQFRNSVGNEDANAVGAMDSNDSVSGKIGNAVNLDVYDRVSFDADKIERDAVSQSIVDTGTISVWFNPDGKFTGGHDEALASFGLDGTFDRALLYLNDNESLRFLVENSNNNTISEYQASVFNGGSWNYAVGAYDQSHNEVYFNGDRKNQISNNISLPPGTDELRGGAGHNGNNNSNARIPLEGQIDELRFSNVKRSQAWISAQHSNQNNPTSFYTIT